MNKSIYEQTRIAASDLCEMSGIKKGQIVVIGCSTSEVIGKGIGSSSSPETAEEIFKAFNDVFSPKGIFIAAQCCEHLNRAIVIEREAVSDADIVNVVPQPKAGGSFASAAYNSFKEPVVVQEIKAAAGLDIGGTLIGMHLKKVAVPIRLSVNQIGGAVLIAARTRPMFIGGSRAVYNEKLL